MAAKIEEVENYRGRVNAINYRCENCSASSGITKHFLYCPWCGNKFKEIRRLEVKR